MKRRSSVGDLNLDSQSSNEVSNDGSCRGAKRRNIAKKGKAKQVPTAAGLLSQNIFNSLQSDPVDVENGGAAGDIIDLRSQVKALTETVRILQGQLDFVLSFIGVQGNTPTADPAVVTAVTTVDLAAPDTHTSPMQTDCEWSKIVQTKPASTSKKPSVRLSDSLRTNLLSAVYVEQNSKDRRARNIIVQGLPEPGNNAGDLEHIRDLLQVEFAGCDRVLTVTSCRRLGKKVSDRHQPLLVTMASVEQAKYLIEHARTLRESVNALVRGHIFINADLTVAEAKAAFELRCRRREYRQNRANKASTVDSAPSSSESSSTGQMQVDGNCSSDAMVSATAHSMLDPAAPSFHSNHDSAPSTIQ
jgi:hypothetical protein